MADEEKSKRAEKRARQKAAKAAASAESGTASAGGYPAAASAKATAAAPTAAPPPVAAAKAKADPKSKADPKAKAKAEPSTKAQPDAQAKAKAKGKAEPKATPAATAAPKAKAAAAPAPQAPAKAQQQQQAAAKAKGKAKAAPAPEPPKEESKSIQDMIPVAFDDGTGGDWEVSASVSKKDKRRQDRQAEQKAAEEAQKAANQKVIPGMAAAPPPQNSIPGMPQTKAEKKAAAAAAAPAAPVAPPQAQEEVKEAAKPGSIVTVMVPENKIGRIIGPKGATLKMLQEKTGVSRIDTTGEMFTITGEPNSVAMAETAMREMIEKGYMSLAFDNFEEASVQVHPSAFPDLIGKQGAVIRKIKEELKAEIEIPPVPKNGHPAKKYKVTIAGSKDAVAKAKEVINDLMMYYHSELTHPGEVHEEIVVQDWQLAYVIGKGGSEMRHIQKNFNVRMYVPREHSMNQQTVIVGERVNVDRAKTYVEKMLWNAEHAPRGRDKAQGAGDYDDNKDDDEQEPWMDQYMFKRKR